MTIADVARVAVGASVSLTMLISGCGRQSSEPTNTGLVRVGSGTEKFQRVTLPSPPIQRSDAQVHSVIKSEERWLFPRIMAGGSGVCDLNLDGRLDLIIVGLSSDTNAEQSQAILQVFQQVESGQFQDVSKTAGLSFDGIPGGIAIADFSNDGLPDLCLTGYGDCRLYQNGGEFSFRDVSDGSDVKSHRWSTSAAFLDFDRDGWLDLFVANYVDYDSSHECRDAAGVVDFCNPAVFPRTTDRLYRNIKGEAKADSPQSLRRFVDVSAESGIAAQRGAGLGVVAADLTEDGWMDIFVANDGHANFLWVNQRNGTFQDEAVLRGVAWDSAGQSQGSMGVAVADLDQNGLPDLAVSNLDGESNAVYINDGTSFRDLSTHWQMDVASWPHTGFGTALADLNHDGQTDYVMVNGRVRRRAAMAAGDSQRPATVSDFWDQYRETQLLLIGRQGLFESPADSGELSKLNAVGRGLAYGDIDRDGDLDLLLTCLDQPPVLLKNEMSDGNWLIVTPRLQSAGHREAIGTAVTAVHEAGRQSGYLAGGGSYQSASEAVIHFGLGKVSRIQQFAVTWPDGTQESFPGADANTRVELVQGQGQAVDAQTK